MSLTPASSSPQDPAPAGGNEITAVGIGASAGGLEALNELLRKLTPDSDHAVLIVQHLDPKHDSELVKLLRPASALPVEWAVDGVAIQGARAYVAPPARVILVREGRLQVRELASDHPTSSVDALLYSLADAYGDHAIAVILSGNGSDGAAGLRAVKAAGGVVFAQQPSSAAFPGMPHSAIATGCVDRVLTPGEIALELGRLRQDARLVYERMTRLEAGEGADDVRQLAAILRFVAERKGVDFSVYKTNTVRRRVARRMMIAKTLGPADYLKLLKRDPKEVDELHESMLISVTEFFRDPECFEFLRKSVLPPLLDRHAGGAPVRIWVPGCATGEEAYTYGILLRELMDERGQILPVQIFGTDISDQAIVQARMGIFSPAHLATMDPARRKRFFHQTERGFSVQKSIRDMCVFARQNLLRDAPFSRLDILSCRNLLIYLTAPVQQKLMPMFHYALNPDGILVLGNSESVSGHRDLFRAVDPRFRVYQPRTAARANVVNLRVERVPIFPAAKVKSVPAMPESVKDPFDAIREADRIVATYRGPPALLVNHEFEIVQFRGDVMPYLAPIAGRASLKLLNMAREGMATELQSALEEAVEKGVRITRPGLSFMQGNAPRVVTVEVTPVSGAATRDRFLLVEFIDQPTAAAAEPIPPGSTEAALLAQISQLRRDLQAARGYVQTTIEQHEAMNQDLRAANEEIQSSNEELQSTNEELETAKEELQSTNEELSTVNDEMHHRHVALMQANNDLANLIGSVHLPILILGPDLTIRRFTSAAERLFNLIPGDIGRPLTDINSNLTLKDLGRHVAHTIETLEVSEFEVQDTAGRWYALRLRPYKTTENKIDGAVVTLVDIDDLKRTMADLEAARDFERAVFETTREPLAALDADLRLRSANQAFYSQFGLEREMNESRLLFDDPKGIGISEALKRALTEILPNRTSLTDEKIEIQLAHGGTARFLANARQIIGRRSYPMILLSLYPLP